MIPGVNSHLHTKNSKFLHLHMWSKNKKTWQLHVEEPLQHTHTRTHARPSVRRMRTYSFTNSELELNEREQSWYVRKDNQNIYTMLIT